MSSDDHDRPDISTILEGAPDNWGTWGEDDELGAVNYLTPAEVLRGISAVEDGETHALGVPIGHRDGDPIWPGRRENSHYMTADKGHYEAGKADSEGTAGLEGSDDVLHMHVQGTTQYDALGHMWYDDELYNGFPAESTKGGLEHCSIEPVAEHGVVGRGVLLDVARHRGVDHLAPGERITLEELLDCAEAQGVDIETRDIPLVRTGWVEYFYEDPDAFYEEFREPGLTYSEALVEWFHDTEIPAFGTDTIANEQTVSDETGTAIPLHGALLRDQGVLFNEILKLDELAEACAADDRWAFCYVGSALKIVGGTGSPVNPLAIR